MRGLTSQDSVESMIVEQVGTLNLRELTLRNIQAPFSLSCIPASVDTLTLEASASKYNSIFDDEEYGNEVGPEGIRTCQYLKIITTHYRLIDWFLERVRPKERLVIEVNSGDIWAAIKAIKRLKVKCHRFDLITEKLNVEGFQDFLSLDDKQHFRELYITDRDLTETFVNDPDPKILKNYLHYCIKDDYKGNRYTINAYELKKIPG